MQPECTVPKERVFLQRCVSPACSHRAPPCCCNQHTVVSNTNERHIVRLQLAKWRAAVERMKLGGKCGAMYVVARDLKAELLDKLDTISTQQLECLQVRCITGLRHSSASTSLQALHQCLEQRERFWRCILHAAGSTWQSRATAVLRMRANGAMLVANSIRLR